MAARIEQDSKIKTSERQGEVVIPNTQIHNCEIPENHTKANNSFTLTTIFNNTYEIIEINFSYPFFSEKVI